MATANGSDDILSNKKSDLNCEPCLSDGRTRSVEGFCMECDEYLCQSCLDAHRILRMSKTHHVKRGEDIPKKKPNKNAQYSAESSCHVHTDSKITSFCKSHKQLCCDQCVILGHKVCTDVKAIGDYSQEFVNSEDYKTAFQMLKDLQSAYTAKKKEASMNLEEVDRYYHKAMETFKAELDKIKISDIRTLKAVVSTYDCVLGQLGSWFESIDTYKNNKQDNELAILVLRSIRDVDTIKDNVQTLCNDDSIVRYDFVPDKSSLLRLVKAPFLVQTITIKHESDEKTCQITDIALLRDDLVLLADYTNLKLKTFNTGNSTFVSNVKLQYKPWQMSVTEHGEAYMAYFGKPKILHLKSPATDLTTFREIDVDGKCYAVECFNKTLKVQCLTPAKTIEVDGEGNQTRIISNDLSKETNATGEQFVTHPYWSTQDSTTGSMYVSCNGKNSITEIKSDGGIKLFVKSDKLNCPNGLCMDTDGSILVCSNSSKDVLRVKQNEDIQSVLPQPLHFNPRAVALDKRTKRLFVAGLSDEMHVFQI
ncbi:uncharacterized protein LOC128216923 [Mya arenaria]|uniref:uncharacterized protein LOC128216923 n=1 Tax=Mya arenaria TaxID=6604 RepID=UPI0022E7A091|nr:uncharacterized protein LOC128216923 [Mya arenaria]